jgi:hypothetical protein
MPITPGAAGTSFDVLLAFSLDAEANRRVSQGISTMEQELKRIQKEAEGVGEEYKESGEKVRDESKKTADSLRQDARAIRAEVASMTSDVRNLQIGLLRDLSGTISSISTKALVAGTAIVGGIFAEVNRYVQKAPEASRLTREWTAATEQLGRARERVDQELLRAALPLLQQVARVATQASAFVSRYPEITSIALKAGTILAGVGVIGLAVSKGIKLVADAIYLSTIPTQLTAAKLQDLAADKQLAAARLQAKDINVPSGGGGVGGTLGKVGAAGAFLAISTAVILGTSKAFDELSKKLISMGGIAAGIGQGIAVANHGIARMGDRSQKAGDQADEASEKISRFGDNEAAIVEAFSDWKNDDARLIREATENRKKIISEGEREIAGITRDYASERVSINKDANQRRAEIVRSFEQESAEAERTYFEDRSRIQTEGDQRLEEMRADHLERLRQLESDSLDRQNELAGDRDALGLEREKERLAKEQEEEIRSFNIERGRAKQETSQRIADLDNQFAAERARRQAQYEQDLRENEAQRAENLARAAEAYQQEVRQAREATAAKLRELQEGLHAERLRRREVFLEQIRDLDASLLGERALRQRRYNEMLQDAEIFFQQYRRAMPSGSSFSTVTGTAGLIPTRDSGGYASRGLYGLAMNGIPEYILSGSTTRAAERAIGGNLSERALFGLFDRLGDVRSAVYNDNRRMEVPLSKDTRRAYEKTAEEAIRRALGGV